MCLALCWKSGCLEGRWTRLVVCQEIKWTVCPWLHLYTCFYFLNVSAERIEQCVRWTRDIHETNKQTKRRREQHQLSHDFLILKCHSYFGQFFFVERRHDVFVTVHHSWAYVYVLNAGGCVQEQIERGREGEHVCMGGGGEHVWECLCIV